MSLQEQIDARSREIHTDRYSMSINEAIAMYNDNDLDIHPEFQRIFRWTLEQQSRLIESIFLGIPVPPIFVAQRENGVWDVVDGVQRLSTILRFMGELRDEEENRDRPVPLLRGEYLTALEDVVWSEDTELDDVEIGALLVAPLDEAQRRFFKRARLDFQIVEKKSDDQAKYDLFQRLNSGTHLSEQEARNCLAVMMDPSFAKWMDHLSKHPSYTTTVDISERREQEAYNVESVLRYLAMVGTAQEDLARMGDVGEFLTERMRAFIEDSGFDRESEQARFEFIFDALETALDDGAFKRYDETKGVFQGRFSISAFEAIASGLAVNEAAWRKVVDIDARSEALRDCAKAVWRDEVFRERAGGGKAANRRIPYMAEVGRRLLVPPASDANA
jgi:hypothetical protein